MRTGLGRLGVDTSLPAETHPLARWRDDIALAWLEILIQIAPKLANAPAEMLSRSLHDGIDAMMCGQVSGGQAAFEPFLDRLEDGLTRAGLRVNEVVRLVLSGSEALDMALPPDLRFTPMVLTAERTLREIAARFAERAVEIVTAELEREAAELELSKERLVSLQKVGAAVTSSLELDVTLDTVVQEATRLMNAEGARLRLADESVGALQLIASAGDLGDDPHGAIVPIETTLAGLCYRTGRPVRSNDVLADPRADQDRQVRSRIRSLLIVPLISRGAAIGVLSIANRQDRPFDDEDESLLSQFADYASIAYENGRLFRQAQQQITELEILNRVSAIVTASLDLDTVYGAIHQEIARIMTADAFLIFLGNVRGGHDLAYVVDRSRRYAPRHDITLPNAYLGTLQRREPQIIELASHPEFATWERYGDMSERIQSLVVAPLVRAGESFGLISAQSYTPKSYRARDVELFVTIANVAAVAIENARLFDRAHDLAVAEERNRLAREIHDTIAQGLVGIILQLEVMAGQLDESSPLHRRVTRALDLARVNLDEARRSVRNLRASPLAQQSFAEAIRQLADEHHLDCGSDVQVDLPESLPLMPQDVESALFRFVQEALTNCRKHAQASVVWISVELLEDLRVVVADNGRGFDIDAWLASAPRHSFGLHGMRERIERLGGTFSIEPRGEGGTLICASVPMRFDGLNTTTDG
jgi:signal transduction histidine kinase